MYKKVYVEITNKCNLKCPFCLGNKREEKFLSIEEWKLILDRLENHTKYLYLHVLGEPLIHPLVNDFINMASKKYYVNITTNGFFIDNIKNNKNIRQINVSLHSYLSESNVSLKDYMNNIMESIKDLKNNSYISLRLWQATKYSSQIIDFLEKFYQQEIRGTQKLEDNVFIEFKEPFKWPKLDQEIVKIKGTCYALKDHIAILVDGTVVPCCLDGLGKIKLGNIFSNSIDEIKMSAVYQNLLQGFKDNKKIHPLCQRCDFIKKEGV